MVTTLTDRTDDITEPDLEFFGVKLKVKNPRLATLLNSSVNENVVVIGRRTVDLLARADEDEGLDALDAFPVGPD
jgi:hypothetical protein